jgi:hypothetical protein
MLCTCNHGYTDKAVDAFPSCLNFGCPWFCSGAMRSNGGSTRELVAIAGILWRSREELRYKYWWRTFQCGAARSHQGTWKCMWLGRYIFCVMCCSWCVLIFGMIQGEGKVYQDTSVGSCKPKRTNHWVIIIIILTLGVHVSPSTVANVNGKASRRIP